jgi:hypothetical protein
MREQVPQTASAEPATASVDDLASLRQQHSDTSVFSSPRPVVGAAAGLGVDTHGSLTGPRLHIDHFLRHSGHSATSIHSSDSGGSRCGHALLPSATAASIHAQLVPPPPKFGCGAEGLPPSLDTNPQQHATHQRSSNGSYRRVTTGLSYGSNSGSGAPSPGVAHTPRSASQHPAASNLPHKQPPPQPHQQRQHHTPHHHHGGGSPRRFTTQPPAGALQEAGGLSPPCEEPHTAAASSEAAAAAAVAAASAYLSSFHRLSLGSTSGASASAVPSSSGGCGGASPSASFAAYSLHHLPPSWSGALQPPAMAAAGAVLNISSGGAGLERSPPAARGSAGAVDTAGLQYALTPLGQLLADQQLNPADADAAGMGRGGGLPHPAAAPPSTAGKPAGAPEPAGAHWGDDTGHQAGERPPHDRGDTGHQAGERPPHDRDQHGHNLDGSQEGPYVDGGSAASSPPPPLSCPTSITVTAATEPTQVTLVLELARCPLSRHIQGLPHPVDSENPLHLDSTPNVGCCRGPVSTGPHPQAAGLVNFALSAAQPGGGGQLLRSFRLLAPLGTAGSPGAVGALCGALRVAVHARRMHQLAAAGPPPASAAAPPATAPSAPPAVTCGGVGTDLAVHPQVLRGASAVAAVSSVAWGTSAPGAGGGGGEVWELHVYRVRAQLSHLSRLPGVAVVRAEPSATPHALAAAIVQVG